MDQLLQHLLNGLLLGATYSLLGIGLTLVFGLMSVVNFAHGEFYTLGAYAAFAALTLASVHFFLAIPLAIAAGAVATTASPSKIASRLIPPARRGRRARRDAAAAPPRS